MVMFKVTFDIEATAQFSAFERYFYVGVIWEKFNILFIGFVILQPSPS